MKSRARALQAALILEAWDVNRRGVGQRRIGIDQEIKLWGKYGLERNVAQSDAEAAKFQGHAFDPWRRRL